MVNKWLNDLGDKKSPIIKIVGPTNILASKETLFSLGAKDTILFIPKKSRKTKEEPTNIPKIIKTFLDTTSVNSLNKIACVKNQINGNTPRASIVIPKFRIFSLCVYVFITIHLVYTKKDSHPSGWLSI